MCVLRLDGQTIGQTDRATSTGQPHILTGQLTDGNRLPQLSSLVFAVPFDSTDI